MVFDKGVRVLEGRKYEYVEDPTIDYAEAGNTGARKVPKGIPSGGINVTVVGSNFNYIQDPAMYIVYQEKRFVFLIAFIVHFWDAHSNSYNQLWFPPSHHNFW